MHEISKDARPHGLWLLPIAAICLILGGCGVGRFDEVEDASPREALEEAQSAAKQAADRARLAAAELHAQVERFDTEDWSDVVGDVRDAADDASQAAVESAKAAEDASVALEDY